MCLKYGSKSLDFFKFPESIKTLRKFLLLLLLILFSLFSVVGFKVVIVNDPDKSFKIILGNFISSILPLDLPR